VRWGGKLQRPPVSPPEQFDPLAERVEMVEYVATIDEELLAFCGQGKAAPDAVK